LVTFGPFLTPIPNGLPTKLPKVTPNRGFLSRVFDHGSSLLVTFETRTRIWIPRSLFGPPRGHFLDPGKSLWTPTLPKKWSKSDKSAQKVPFLSAFKPKCQKCQSRILVLKAFDFLNVTTHSKNPDKTALFGHFWSLLDSVLPSILVIKAFDIRNPGQKHDSKKGSYFGHFWRSKTRVIFWQRGSKPGSLFGRGVKNSLWGQNLISKASMTRKCSKPGPKRGQNPISKAFSTRF